MKNVLIYLFTFLIICFILPAILTKTTTKVENAQRNSEKQEEEETTNDNVNKEKYQYNKYGKIKLLHSKSGEIEEVELDTYLCNVVSAEMPADFHIEALKAQAREENWNKIETAVNSTNGKIITYNNQPINAFFHSNSGGITELPVNVWGGGNNLPYLQIVETSGEDTYNQFSSEVSLTNDELLSGGITELPVNVWGGGNNLPYLQIVETSGEDTYNQFSSEVSLTNDELLNKLKEKHLDIKINFEDDEEIKILEYTINLVQK